MTSRLAPHIPEVYASLFQKLRQKLPIKDSLNPDERKKLDFYIKFFYGVAAYVNPEDLLEVRPLGWMPETTLNEFVGQLGENYVSGKGYFFRSYGEFFSEETVEKLYNFVRDDIFRGREY